MVGFLLVAFFGLLTASVSLYALTITRTLLGVLPLLVYLATIARALQVGIRDPIQRSLCMMAGSGIVFGLALSVFPLDRIVSEHPGRIFAMNGVILFSLLTGLQLGTEQFDFYSRLTTTHRRWLNRAWFTGITLSLLLYCVYGLQGDWNVVRFVSDLWTAITWN
jgi:hypothetical protein